MMKSIWLAVSLGSVLALVPFEWSPLRAATCSVPGSHTTIQKAVGDATCTTIDLAARTYSESVRISRTLSIQGPQTGSAIIEGKLEAQGASTQVTVVRLLVTNGCSPAAVSTSAGAKILGDRLEVTRAVGLPCPPVVQTGPIFSDDFESGDTSAWTSVVP